LSCWDRFFETPFRPQSLGTDFHMALIKYYQYFDLICFKKLAPGGRFELHLTNQNFYSTCVFIHDDVFFLKINHQKKSVTGRLNRQQKQLQMQHLPFYKKNRRFFLETKFWHTIQTKKKDVFLSIKKMQSHRKQSIKWNKFCAAVLEQRDQGCQIFLGT
jgi:hypothetical protein